jgi:hypothetical protein
MPRWVVNLYNVRISSLARSLGQFLAVRCTRLRNQVYSLYKRVKGGENHSSESQTDQVSLGEPEVRRVTTAGQYPVQVYGLMCMCVVLCFLHASRTDRWQYNGVFGREVLQLR